ncbi:VRR-NUC domain-containing protein, partial [Pisolithus croceorrhizus]
MVYGPVSGLVFPGGDTWTENVSIEDTGLFSHLFLPGSSTLSQVNEGLPRGQHISIYVQVFEEMLDTVLQHEAHLFDDKEILFFDRFTNLSYNARFLMVRLLLRKLAWHRIDSLKYQRELGGHEAVVAAVDEICRNRRTAGATQDVSAAHEIIDLTLEWEHSESVESTPGYDGTCSSKTFDSDTTPIVESFVLAEDEDQMDLETLLDCLKTNELRLIARQLRLKPNGKKQELIASLLRTASSQSTLTSVTAPKGSRGTKSTTLEQTALLSAKPKMKSQLERLRAMVLRVLVKCVRVHSTFYGLVQRANLVFFRLSQYSPDLLVTALLPRFKKRAYSGYKCARSKDIWKTREALLEYEEALILEGRVDAVLGEQVFPGSQTRPTSRSQSPKASEGVKSGVKKRDYAAIVDEDSAFERMSESARLRRARLVKEIFENVYPRWQDILRTKTEEQRSYGLQRFESGHVFTRIIYKGSCALGTLGEYKRELEVLESLLAQRRWHRGRRGSWHERRALILSAHFPKSRDTARRALTAVIEALEDPDTHLVYRPKLQRRLRRLEVFLGLPPVDRFIFNVKLESAEEVIFEAIRIRELAADVASDRTGKNRDIPPRLNHDLAHYFERITTPTTDGSSEATTLLSAPKSSREERNGKSRWEGRNGEELTVEALALQRYEGQGYRGIHCETRMITLIFGLLFWDIIFAPIPGVFETPYQAAPLDIAEDSFFYSRQGLMEKRLSEIKSGATVNIIRRVDATHRTSETWCVGVQWDLVNCGDVLDIVTCIGGEALSVMCRVLCEDYAARQSGGPDLFLWNAEQRLCKFVEVKGPGDTLRENQKVWIDVLLRAQVPVEICRVVENG